MIGPAWLTQWKIAPLGSFGAGNKSTHNAFLLCAKLPPFLVQLYRSVTRARLQLLPWILFEAPTEKVFSSPVSCRSRASLCTVAGTMKVLEN